MGTAGAARARSAQAIPEISPACRRLPPSRVRRLHLFHPGVEKVTSSRRGFRWWQSRWVVNRGVSHFVVVRGI